MRKSWLAGLSLAVWAAGCGATDLPKRNVDFRNVRQVLASFLDYKRLEQSGVETVQLHSAFFDRTVSLPFYLFTIAQGLETFGREHDAVKLYLRLLANYPLLHDGNQLGVLAENRLLWLIGDQHWVMASVDELVRRLVAALKARDVEALQRLVSRDFGFGRTYQERYAVPYEEGLELISAGFPKLGQLRVEVKDQRRDGLVLVKTGGWDDGQKSWTFALRRNARRQGWEWDLAYWEEKEPRP